MRLLLILLTAAIPLAAAAPLQPVYRLKPVHDKQRFITADEYDFKSLQPQIETISFLAVCTNIWPAGLVPIFSVEKTNRFELRRRPALGQENASEPLFFALPPADEPDAAKLAGRWECVATRPSGSKESFGWDLAIDGDKVAGRFDQFTDFRFARIAGGAFRSNRLEFRVEYIMDAYVVTGTLHEGKFTGAWTRVEESEEGAWEATRPVSQLPLATNLVALYEWRRSTDDARRYLVESEQPPPNWRRSPRPLCRVWKPR